MNKSLHVMFFLIGCMLAIQLYAQPTKISGSVKNVEGEGLPGVGIQLKNGRNLGMTDAEGRFSLDVTGVSSVLLFSSVGYVTKEITVSGGGSIAVVLQSSHNDLDQVVVVGYGTVRKGDITGAVGQVNMKDLNKAPVATFAQALAGRVSGVRVSSGDGQPGSGSSIVIRGEGSLSQSVRPLYVVDGFPLEDFDPNYLSPSDIESINVLKDASATAIYGARAANGVIVIETVKGQTGLPKISFNGSYGLNSVTKRMEMMSGYDFVNFQLQKYPAEAVAALYPDFTYVSGGPLPDPEVYRNAKVFDWQDLLYQDGFTAINNLSISGGTDKTKYLISGSGFNQKGSVIQTGYRRYQGRVMLDQTVSKKLKVGINLTYADIMNHGVVASDNTISGNGTSALFYSIWGYRPVSADGLRLDEILIDPDINSSTDLRINPLISVKNEKLNRKTTGFLGNSYLNWGLAKGLTLRVQGGLDRKQSKNDYYFNSQTNRGAVRPGNTQGVQAGVTFVETNVLSNDNTLSYKRQFNKIHEIDLVGGMSLQSRNYETYSLNSIGIPNEDLGLSGLDDGLPFTNGALLSDSRLLSYFARGNYGYLSKYLLTLTARYDGSSKFSPEHRWGFFPSGALAWKMSEENFIKALPFVSDAKLRISYGLTGNNRVGDFENLASIAITTGSAYPFNNQIYPSGAYQSDFGNSDLKWETTAQWNLGYDLSLFKNRVEIVADVYRKTTNDLLLNSKMPYVTGFSSAFKNIGKIQNDGLELTLNTQNYVSKNFNWQSSFNIGFNNNKVLSLNEGEDFILSGVSWHSVYNNQALYSAKVGEPAAQFIGLIWEGVYQLEDFNITTSQAGATTYELKPGLPANGVIRSVIRPGDIRYKDINGDGNINDQDRTVIGRALPIHSGGFSNNFDYKGLSLNVFFQWSYGNDILNANRILFEGDQGARPLLNQFASYVDRWSPDNTSSRNYRAGAGSASGPSGVYSTRTIEDGSFLRLKTVSLAYRLPSAVIKSLGIKSLSLSATAENLYTWTKYSGMDPEVSVRHSVLTPGLDFSPYPRAKTIVFSVNALF